MQVYPAPEDTFPQRIPMRILHLADLHLGKIIFDLHLTVDQQHILEQIVAIAVREAVDVVVISGDLYDRSIPPVRRRWSWMTSSPASLSTTISR